MRKKITILFNGENLSYSPTVIGLYDLLSKQFDVNIIARAPVNFDNKLLPNRKVNYIKGVKSENLEKINNRLVSLFARFSNKIALIQRKIGNLAYEIPVAFYEFMFIRKCLSKDKPDFIIAVDFRNLWYAQILNKKVEFLSLEIVPNDRFYHKCSFKNINSVVIQTRERYEHLFNDKKFKTFFIQNAPVFTAPEFNQSRQGLVYCGTAWEPFGFYHCLEFLKSFPDYTLTVKGAILNPDRVRVENQYSDLLSNKRLIIDNKYLDDNEVVSYLRKFRIGFCFYNFDIDYINNFNYLSAPSGKMFKYFAAGVPVIGQDILGLKPIREFDCGILIKDLKPESIKGAIDAIESNFDYYSQNCLKAAEHYSFDKTAQPFIDYLMNQ
jgi:glycosyltransferase involved in cell wall biosynthesis